jgi:diadenosine tetraphosphatase ApaH/serine/threonine PP2A family protein phosphatase
MLELVMSGLPSYKAPGVHQQTYNPNTTLRKRTIARSHTNYNDSAGALFSLSYVHTLQSIRPELARGQRVVGGECVRPIRGGTIDIRGPPRGQREPRSEQPPTFRRDDFPHHRLPPEHFERLHRRRPRPILLQDRHRPIAAAQHSVL